MKELKYIELKSSMTKVELIEYAKEREIEIDSKKHKEEIYDYLCSIQLLPTITIDDGEIFKIMDDYDTDQIVQELIGNIDAQMKKIYLYEFQQGGKTIRGLSKSGVEQLALIAPKECGQAFRMEGDPNIVETEDSFRATVTVGRYSVRGIPSLCKSCGKPIPEAGTINTYLIDTSVGAAREPKKSKITGGRIRDNRFAFRVAISKAKRNAILSLLPHNLKVSFMALLAGEKNENVRQITGETYVSQRQTKRLHAIASERGLGHKGILEIIHEYGYDSTNKITVKDYGTIVKKIEEKPVIVLPKEITKALELLGQHYPKAKAQADWLSAVTNYGEEKAAERMMKYINKMVDERVEENK